VENVAVIADIHGNLPALEASLREIERLGVDAVYCGGDLVGYGPHPNEVCALIEERGIPTIYGNYDYAIARDLEDCGCAYVTPEDRALGQRSVAWTLEHTSRRAKHFMRDLPFDLSFSAPLFIPQLRLGLGAQVVDASVEYATAELDSAQAWTVGPTAQIGARLGVGSALTVHLGLGVAWHPLSQHVDTGTGVIFAYPIWSFLASLTAEVNLRR